MQTITIAARKGGVGKTTLATHLSVIAAGPGKPVLLFDTDPQRSLKWWWDLRQGDTPALVECEARELPKILPAAKAEGVAFCIVDTPPHAETSIADAMRVADLVLVPTRPGAVRPRRRRDNARPGPARWQDAAGDHQPRATPHRSDRARDRV